MQNVTKQEQRPDPDSLLKKINKEARGKLTVFLGATAGVGKTYTMLEAAHERLLEGLDVVIGWVETHGRRETERLVDGLPKIPAKPLEYRGKTLFEMDIDAILAGRPELVLVDELAHTNITGSRNVRRFQDVEELLAAGVNVYTTLNIQHIESLNDVVAQITGIVVRETVPDYILEQADKVQLIDIPSEDLIERLKEGKVYVPGQAEQALRKFFRPGNINALRELSLRYTASRVDKDLSAYMREHKIDGPWPAAGRVMVCVSGSPFSAQLIRVASRLASGMKAECLAVHIDVTKQQSSDSERSRIAGNLRLAEELGAKTLSVDADDLIEKIMELARVHNATAIVVGKPRRSRLWELVHGSVVNRLIRNSGNLNIYVIQTGHESELKIETKIDTSEEKNAKELYPFVNSLLMVAAVTLLSYGMQAEIEPGSIALLYQLPVVLSAFWWGRWPAYFTGICSVLVFDFLFIPPFYTFSVEDIRHLWSFFTFLLVAFIIGGRTELLRHEAVAAKMREKSTRALFEFSREIAAVIDLDTIARQFAMRAADALNRRIMVLLPDEKGNLSIWADCRPVFSDSRKQGGGEVLKQGLPDNAESAVAAWAYEHRRIAGRATETLPGAKNLYLPLMTRENVVGLLGIEVVEKLITPEQQRLMEAWAGLAAIAIERVKLTEKAREATLVLESDRLRTALLNSISHELRTPLSSIMGSASTLLEADSLYSASDRRELLETIHDGSNRMNLILSNLLDTARIESGMLKLKEDWCDIEDVIGTALHHLTDRIGGRRMDIDIPAGLPLLRGDCVLLGQVIINLIDNALKYSPADSGIAIQACASPDKLTVSIADRGPGIPAEDITKVFDKFYRIQHDKINIPGTGLGLSICKSIVEAHGGEITAENRSDGGSIFSFSIPITQTADGLATHEVEGR